MAINNTEGTNNEGEELSLRDSLDAAFAQHATDETEPRDTERAEAPASAPAAQSEGVKRDAHGRFAAKEAQAAEAQGATQEAPAQNNQAQQAEAAPAAPAAPDLKPPASWAPTAREKWAGVDPEIRGEVHRREREMQQVLQQGAQARQFIQAFENVVRPYEVFIRQENSNPLQAVQNMMQTAATLRVGTPQDKAQLVAGLIRNFGIDIQTLDTLLANAPASGHMQPQQAQYRDPRVDQLLAQQAQQQQSQQQAMNAEVTRELQAFAASHEFFHDVQGIMSELMEIRGRQGQVVDLESAYKAACQMHDGVSKTLAQRAASANNGAQSQAVLRAKRAAASVKGESTPHSGATVPKNDTVRASIEAAIESLSN